MNSGNWFLTFLNPEKLKIKVIEETMSGEGELSVKIGILLLCVHTIEREPVTEDLFYKNINAL
jgi:hypothetical protein